MVRPAGFGYNPDTARTNTFQRPGNEAEGPAAAAEAQASALEEFGRLQRALESEGVEVCAVADTAAPVKPDAVFPNNWVSFHEGGTLASIPWRARAAGPSAARKSSSP
jgi:hypothetical protein